MNIQTKYFDEVTISEADIITFPNGLLGFPDETKFIGLDIPDNPSFLVLQSINDANIAFIVIPPYQLYQNYELKIDDTVIGNAFLPLDAQDAQSLFKKIN